MNAKQLKDSILQYAMQGNLVPQKSNETINCEIEETEEQIFEIPTTWKWVTLSSLGETKTGSTPPVSNNQYYDEKYMPFIKPSDLIDGKLNYDNHYVSKKGAEKGRIIDPYSLLMVCIGGSRGKLAVNEKEIICNQQINTITCNSEIVDYKYLNLVLQSKYFQDLMQYRATGTATPIVNKSMWSSFPIPLPPIDEQKRIVEKFNEIRIKIYDYEQREFRYKKISNEFPTQLEKSILQYAMQGKLVEQQETDEPASFLVEQIKVEKQRLVKEKLIKKEKTMSEITEDEILFDIPNTWEWVRLGEITLPIMGQAPKGESVSEIYSEGAMEFHQGKSYFGEKMVEVAPKFVIKPNKKIEQTAILMSVRAPVGDVNIVNRTVSIGRGLAALIPCNGVNLEYLYYILKNLKYDFEQKATGSTFKAITADIVKEQLIPLPPIDEQKRIVKKINDLLCLKNELN